MATFNKAIIEDEYHRGEEENNDHNCGICSWAILIYIYIYIERER
ncbi:MAG: hypothetical protein ACI8RD_013103, partial [Bacillariaceae sp.]